VGLVEPKIAFLSIGFGEIYCQSKNQHHENQSYVAVFEIKSKICIGTLFTKIEPISHL